MEVMQEVQVSKIDSVEILNKTTMLEHILELKRRLILIVSCFVMAFGFCYFFSTEIYKFLLSPLVDIYSEIGIERKLIYTNLAEAFFTHIKLAGFCAFLLCFPLLMTQVYFFVAPGLYKREKKALLPYIILSPFLFAIGAALVYYFIMPIAWKFFLSFESQNIENLGVPLVLEAKVSEYLSLTISLILAFGIAFQLPLILVLLCQLGFLGSNVLKKYRRHAIVFIFLLSAVLTPPDVISQIGLAIPLILLYEISLLICKRIENNIK